MRLTVVIPTRNRAERLFATLEDLASQATAGMTEVVVADDGSTDATAEILASTRFQSLHLESVRLEARGPAAARNLAIRRGTGDRVLLLGDDTWPARGCLDAHRSCGNEEGLQGRIDWDPGGTITPVMAFLAPAGPQFYFKGLEEGDRMPYWGVLGSNLSAPRRWFLEEPYDEGFVHAAFEDTELAYRWQRKGWKVQFSSRALSYHDHRYDSIEPFLEKQRQAGRAARRALGRHPMLIGRVVLHPLLFGLLVGARLLLGTSIGQARQEDVWDLAVRRAFFRGLLAT